jgi:hypothetical protein
MVTLPVATPVTVPVVAPTVATDGLLLVHVPPVTVFISIAAEPTQTVDEAGEIAAGVISTVTSLVAEQPATV